MTALMRHADRNILRLGHGPQHLDESAAIVAAQQKSGAWPDQMQGRHSLEYPWRYQLPAKMESGDIATSEPRKPRHTVRIDRLEAGEVGHKPFGHFHFHSPPVACRPDANSRAKRVNNQCCIRSLSPFPTGDAA